MYFVVRSIETLDVSHCLQELAYLDRYKILTMRKNSRDFLLDEDPDKPFLLAFSL